MSEILLIILIILVLVAAVLLLNARQVTTIYPPNVGLLYRDGRFRRQLAPGRYTGVDPLKRSRIVQVSTAPLPLYLAELTVVSSDQFSFRISLSPVVEVVDARAFAESQPAPSEPNRFVPVLPQLTTHPALQPLAAAAALEAVGSITLRELFADAKLVTDAVQAKLESSVPGAAVRQVLLTSITLPPETRRMFTDVERSKLEAEASLERARGEQASLRALANAARLVKDNPALANLRFLQTLEQAPGAKTIVLGADAVAHLRGDAGGAA
jgi:regulator of protease activity HflC (stomatin/prohibitin superfamily)